MQITLNNLIPNPLTGTNQSGSGLWLLNELILHPSKINLALSPSGKGKSSLIHFLYGIRKDYSGEILFDQKSCRNLAFNDWIELRKRRISVVFQDLRLFSNLTAFENIDLKNNLTKHKSTEQIYEMCQKLDVESLLNRKISTLSYGQQQRIAIVRALCQPFDWIFMDEPFSHLDKINIHLAMHLIHNEVQKNNAGMLLTLLHPEDCVQPDYIINI